MPPRRRSARRLPVRAALALALLCGSAPALSTPVAAAAALPDDRAYELVSPTAKLGNDVIAETSRTRAAAAQAPGLPMAVTFASLGGFADVQGTGISTEYLAQRTGTPGTSGWATHAITPAQLPLTISAVAQNLDPLYEGDLSADLSRGVFRAWSPVTSAQNVQEVENLYAREDLRTPGVGSYRLLTDAAAPLAPIRLSTQRPFLAAATDDLAHVLFESRQPLTADASSGNFMLYKADGDSARLLAPGTDCPGAALAAAAAAPCSVAGAGVLRQTSRALSADGSRVLLTSPVSGNGNVTTTPGAVSDLYQFDDRGTAADGDDTLVQVNASEKTVLETPQAAIFESASRNGSQVFFTTAEQLTDTPGSGLYRWQRQPAGGSGSGHLTLIGRDATGVLGASADGTRVYFIAAGQLVPGGPSLRENGLYLWQAQDGAPGDGTLSFIGAISFADSDANIDFFPWNRTPIVSRVTPDGRTLLFEVADGSGLAPGRDHGSCARNANSASSGGCSELYVYRADGSTPLAPNLACASCVPGGGPATASAFVNVRDGAGASQSTAHLSRALSDDGRRIFFSTAQALVLGDVNGKSDAYEYDVPSGTVRLISSGRDPSDTYFMDASASGDDVFLLTREQLTGWDVDQAYDLYDARVGGGFPEPAAAAAPCAGDACHGLSRGAPPPVSLGSPAFGGLGDFTAARHRVRAKRARCRQGSARKRVHGRKRCVKRARRRQRR